MKVTIWRESYGPEIGFFDMTGQTWPQPYYMRIGDRAAIHLYLLNCRALKPDRKLIVMANQYMPGNEFGNQIPPDWFLKDIIDELWLAESADEKIHPPEGGHSLYSYPSSLWYHWKHLRKNRVVDPTLRPREQDLSAADRAMREMRIPQKFVAIQPLFDAEYDVFRNGSVNWWADLIYLLSRSLPVVVMGAARNEKALSKIKNGYPLWKLGLSPMEAMALMSRASVFGGGETGFTLWAPIFRVPTVAIYGYWSSRGGSYTEDGGHDSRPISFGSPVIFQLLEGDIVQIVSVFRRLFNGEKLESTPTDVVFMDEGVKVVW